MSVTAELEQLQKRRAELENERASLEQKEQAIKETVRELQKKVEAQLKEEIKTRNTALEKWESTRMDLEKRLEELQRNRESSSRQNVPNVPIPMVAEEKEAPTEQVVEAAAEGSQQPQCTLMEEKKRK